LQHFAVAATFVGADLQHAFCEATSVLAHFSALATVALQQDAGLAA